MRCIKCGFENSNNINFCENCGSALNSTQQSQQSISNLNNINSVASSTAVATASSIGITKIIIAIIIVIVAIVGVIIGVNYLSGDKGDNKPENSSNNSNAGTSSNAVYSTYTADVPRSERNLDYYWNINTATFDKTKFDGRISVFGTVMNTKLTGKTLKDAGFIFVDWGSKDGNPREVTKLDYDNENKIYSDYGLLYKNDKVYPSYNYNVVVYLKNYKNIENVYDDSTELYFKQTTIYDDKENVIVPYIENIDYSEMTIDDIIDTLGAPTYVENRTSKLEDADTSYGFTYFNYIYVYDDYVFKFNFMYSKKASIIERSYMDIRKFNRPFETYNFDTQTKESYDKYSDYLVKQQNEYLKAIGSK